MMPAMAARLELFIHRRRCFLPHSHTGVARLAAAVLVSLSQSLGERGTMSHEKRHKNLPPSVFLCVA